MSSKVEFTKQTKKPKKKSVFRVVRASKKRIILNKRASASECIKVTLIVSE